MNIVHIFGVITEDFTSPIMHFDGKIYFADVSFSFKADQCFYVIFFQYFLGQKFGLICQF